jgi:hypothetical protein
MLSGPRSVGTAARSENKSSGTTKAQISPGASGMIAARITAARQNQAISVRKEYILGIDDTPGRVQNWLAMAHTRPIPSDSRRKQALSKPNPNEPTSRDCLRDGDLS